MTKAFVTTLSVLALAVLSAPWAWAQSGAKALFYGSSGATLQSNAPVSGPTMSRTPDVPASNLATGFPSTPAMPGMMPPPPPTMPAMTPPPTMPAMTPPPEPTMPGVPPPPPMPAMTPPPVPAAAGQPTEDLTKIIDQLKAATDSLPPAPPGSVAAVGTKDLTVAGSEPLMGVKYWVELLDQKGTRRQVTTDYVFRAGDRIKVHVTSNRDGYLTLVNLGSTGRTTVLFPGPGGANNFVKAGADYPVPPGSYLRFDANRGQELLVLTFSPQAGATTPSAALAMARGAKDLVTEVDASGPQPATYAVAPVRPGNDAGTIAIQIKLNHQ